MTTTAESGSMGLDAPDTLLWTPEPHAAPAAALETTCDSAVWTHARKGARIFWAGAEPLRLLAGTCAVGDALALAAPAVLLPPLLGTGGFDLRFEVVSATVLGVALTLEFLHLVGVYGHAATERLPPQLARATAA